MGVQHVEAASVTLFVIDRLHLSPAGDTYLLQGSTIRYSLWNTEHGGETGTNTTWFMLFWCWFSWWAIKAMLFTNKKMLMKLVKLIDQGQLADHKKAIHLPLMGTQAYQHPKPAIVVFLS